jgi:solute carrier family 39 (zinc transporter), member 1/2/3
MVLILALGIHSLFAGLGLGGADGYDIVVLLFIAIIAHKFFEAFALGIRLKIWLMPSLLAEEFSSATQDSVNTTSKKTEDELVKNPKKTFLSILFLYSLCTPLGMVIGMAAQTATSGSAALAVSGISIGLAAGSFIYVAMVEVLPHALEAPLIGPKIIMSLIGTALMAALAVFV